MCASPIAGLLSFQFTLEITPVTKSVGCHTAKHDIPCDKELKSVYNLSSLVHIKHKQPMRERNRLSTERRLLFVAREACLVSMEGESVKRKSHERC